MTSVPSEREIPLITTVDHSAEFLKGPVLNWLINQNSDISGQASWVHTDSDSSQLIDSIVSLQAAESLTSSLFSLLATVFYRYSYQSGFELHFAHGLDQKQSDISKAIQFYRIQFRDHTLANNAEISTKISNVLSSLNAESLQPDSSFESAYSIIELEGPSSAELKKLHQAFEHYQGVIWLVIEQQDSGYQLKWLCSGKISVDVIQVLQTHMLNLIGSVHRQPTMPLSKHTILSDQEIQQQLDFSKGKIIQDQKQPLFKIIENYAHARADKVAVIYQQTQLTYQQLNQQANYLAHALLAKNIAPGDGVAVHINPSENILVAILAIHKIGAIYIPIDPSFPTARVSAILEEVNPLVILCDSLTSDIPEQFSVICADIEELKKSAISGVNPGITVPTESISHIYFTSGTTGKPKGVMATHKNLIHYISAALNRYGFNQDDCFIAAAKFTFSISMFELMNPLVAGGCVRVIAREQVLDLKQLCQAVAASTVFHFGPSLLKQLLPFIEDNYSSFESFDKLRHVSSGGDMVPPEILEKLKKIFSNAEVFVIYGSSEISCMGCTFEVSRDQTITRTRVGSPHQNMKVRIFDNDGNMVPIGVAGQLYFSGGGLVHGYLNLPELTDEKFKTIDGERFYAIGDVGRLDSDGNIELLGREDFQIQLRGIRIELAEIDGYLRKIPELKDAVASAQNLGGSDEKSIVAYVVSKTSAPLSVNEMKKYLLKYVPDYMIPAAFVQLDALPLNHNMKLDRKALPAPTKQNLLSRQVKSIGTTDTINKLVDIINQVCATGVTSDDAVLDFYALGIESIALMQIRLLINKQLERELPLKILQQEHTSIEALANYLDSDASLSEQVIDAQVEKIQIVPRDQLIIASFSQQRIWFLDRLMGASGLYNIPWAIRLNGKLNVAALQQSFDAIIVRHESLRTCFSEEDGEPLQVIKDTVVFQCELIDLSTLPPESQNSESQRILDTEANKAFDLKQAPLIRAALFKLSENEHILAVNMHHIVSDGWSMQVFKQELASYYCAFSQGQSAILPELAIQYADYAGWQRQWLQGEFVKKQLSFWKTQLAGLTVLELPTDHPRPKQLSYRGALEPLLLSKELTRSLKVLSQAQGVSLFMTLLAAFQVLMHRYSGQDDIVVGSPIAGRNQQEVEHLIGFFINTLVLRSDLSGNPSFSELLKCVRKTCVDAYAHQDVPFEEVVTELQPERDMSRHPLFQVMLILQPELGPEIQLPDLDISDVTTSFDGAKFDLTLSFQEHEDGLKGVIEYSTDLFDAATMMSLAGHFQTLLEGIVARPETLITELPLLTAPEQHQLLVDWNNTAADYPKDQTLVTLFEQQVEKTPDAIAVVFEDQQLSYQQLNDKANQLAHYLASLKDQAGTNLIIDNPLIAIAVDRSLNMAVSLLAILKAGGAYVPIDPDYPIDRIHHMLNDSAAPLILTQSHLQTHLSLDVLEHDCIVVCLDELGFDDESIENPKIIGQAEDLAYVIYTSGSTGKPKGVMIEHHNLSNFLQDMQQRIGISINDKLLAVTTLSFDIHALEFHLPLISGSTLYIATRTTANDGLALQQQLATHQINYMQATPITWELLKHSDWQPDARLNILCGGEALIPELANYLSANGSCVWNVYGPTETTIWSSAYSIEETLNSYPSIGKPIANTRIYILNKQHQLQPANIPGELCIAGEGLARGYLNRSELTAEKFIEIELFGKTERIYKTGDLARWLPDGNLECLGRIDHQIKLRGFRIELGEIESVLGQYTGVNGVVVTAREDQPGDKRLVAYLTHLQEEPLKVNELRNFLKEKLPDYMIPSAFVFLDQFPHTPNGKIDRNALPAPDKAPAEMEQTYVAPRSSNEERLAFIWQEILQVGRVGIHDDFFALGGHSLLVVRLLAQIEKAFDKKFSLVTVFQAPTIAQFSDLLSSDVSNDYSDSPVHLGKLEPSEKDKTKATLFCIYGVFLYQDLAKYLVDDVSVYGVFIQEEVDLIKAQAINDSLSLDVPEIAKRYIKQIRSVQKKGPYNLAGASFGGVVAFEIAQQLIAEGEKVNILALFDAMAPTGFKWSLPHFLGHHMRQIMIKGIPYLIEKLHKKIAKKPDKNINNSDGSSNNDIRVMVRKTAVSSFSPSPYPGKISLFKVKDEKLWAGYKVDPYYGWRQFAEDGVDLVEISSTHLGLLQEPNVQDITDYLRKYL